jgi:hypothetical protein
MCPKLVRSNLDCGLSLRTTRPFENQYSKEMDGGAKIAVSLTTYRLIT